MALTLLLRVQGFTSPSYRAPFMPKQASLCQSTRRPRKEGESGQVLPSLPLPPGPESHAACSPEHHRKPWVWALHLLPEAAVLSPQSSDWWMGPAQNPTWAALLHPHPSPPAGLWGWSLLIDHDGCFYGSSWNHVVWQGYRHNQTHILTLQVWKLRLKVANWLGLGGSHVPAQWEAWLNSGLWRWCFMLYIMIIQQKFTVATPNCGVSGYSCLGQDLGQMLRQNQF